MNLEELGEARGDPEEMVNLLLVDASQALSADGQAEFQGIVAPLKTSDSTAKIENAVRAAKRVVEADEKHLNVGYRFSIWKKAIDASTPDLPIVVIERRDNENPATVPCARCTKASSKDVDQEIFELFTGGSELSFERDQILLAGRDGKLAFKAALSDIAEAPECAARAKVLAATNSRARDADR